ncbi:MAG: MFS transporter, partial [Lachnospiraceae bacterium]
IMSEETAKKKKEKNPNHLSFWKLLAFKSSDISAAWVNVIVLSYLSMYCSDVLGINIAVVGTLLLVSRVIDAITDLVAGWIVDNTHSRLGKGRPYELCIIGETICTILLFSCSPEWSTVVKCAWIVIMYTFVFSIFATLRNAAATPYTIRAFSNNSTVIRKVASYGGIITMAGSIAMATAFPMLMAGVATSASGWSRLIAVIMIAATFIGLFRFIFIKEDPSVDVGSSQQKIRPHEIAQLFKRNKYVWIYAAMMLCYNIITNLAVSSYYFRWVVGNVGLAGVLSAVGIIILPIMFAFPAIMKKMGSMGKMVGMLCIIGVIGYLIAFVSGSNIVGVVFGYLLGSLGGLPLAYYGVLFVMNICSYNEILGMPRMDATSSSLGNFCAKLGAALGSFVTGIMLSIGGYVSAQGVESQPGSAIFMIRVDFAIVPAILMVVITICAFAFAKLEPKVNAFEAEKKAKQEAAGKEQAAQNEQTEA